MYSDSILNIFPPVNPIHIDVWNCRCAVARYLIRSDGTLTVQYARNWEALEQAAADAVYEQGGGYNISGRYFCPDWLAAQAEWDNEEEESTEEIIEEEIMEEEVEEEREGKSDRCD